MERTRKSRALFLGAWLTVLIAGFITSRVSTFAAGGLQNCEECEYCEYLKMFWDQGSNKDWGYVTQDQGTPVLQALGGTLDGFLNDIYGYGCNGTDILENQNTIYDDVTYKSADPGCNYPTRPFPPGRYAITNPQGMNYWGTSDYQTNCFN